MLRGACTAAGPAGHRGTEQRPCQRLGATADRSWRPAGDQGPAFVEAQPHVRLPAAAFGTGQDDGQIAPRREGAKANGKALGLPLYGEGQRCSAASPSHSAVKL
jgi:hypothetical protein